MNWKKLKEKFPNSYPQIREHQSKTGIEEGRTLITNFLENKGYKTGLTFIRNLTDYEKKQNNGKH